MVSSKVIDSDINIVHFKLYQVFSIIFLVIIKYGVSQIPHSLLLVTLPVLFCVPFFILMFKKKCTCILLMAEDSMHLSYKAGSHI